MRVHFEVGEPHQLVWVDDPARCLVLPGLQLVAVALADDGFRCFTVMELGHQDRFFLGPDRDVVQRRAAILGMAVGAAQGDRGVLGRLVHDWVVWTWDAAVAELAEELAAPALATLDRAAR